MVRPDVITSTDVALLRALARERSLVGASRRVGISRDRAVYRIARLRRAFGEPVVRAARGGAGHGGTVLTALGDRLARGGYASLDLLGGRPVPVLGAPNVLRGVYRGGPVPAVETGGGLRLRVAFPADDGAPVAVVLDPEAVVVARRRFPSSARNVLRGVVQGLRRGRADLGLTLLVRCAGDRLRVAVTDEPVRQLRLRRGTPVWLYVKATAVRRVEGGGGPR
jgi:molybdate transport repressor ModE-like protein/molybdopterin-binding protein